MQRKGRSSGEAPTEAQWALQQWLLLLLVLWLLLWRLLCSHGTARDERSTGEGATQQRSG